MTKLNLSMRQLTGKAYPLLCCRLPDRVLTPTCPYSRFNAPLSPSTLSKGFPRPLTSQKQEAKSLPPPARADRQCRSAIARVQYRYPKPTLTYPKAGCTGVSRLSRGSKWGSVLWLGLQNFFAFRLKMGGGCVRCPLPWCVVRSAVQGVGALRTVSHNYNIMLYCLQVPRLFQLTACPR